MRKKFAINFVVSLFFLFALNESVDAAIVQVVQDEHCDVSLRGQIQEGDLEQLQAAAELSRSEGIIFPRLCLESGGGSFVEAVHIAEFIHAFGVSTVLRSGAQCLSACAWIFMFGTERWDDEPISARSMSLEAQLGFHALSIIMPPRASLPRSDVERGFAVLMEAFARLLELGGIRSEYAGAILKLDLIQAAMAQPSGVESFFYIDNVDKIGRWGINILEDISLDVVSEFGAHTVCLNATAWHAGLSSSFYEGAFVYQDFERNVVYNSSTEAYEVVGPRQGMREHRCTVAARSDINGFFVCVEDGGLNLDWCGTVDPFYAFLPSTLLELVPSWVTNPNLRAASGAVSGLPGDVDVQCWLSNSLARVTNVNEYVNLRRQPNFSAPVIREVPRGEQVRVISSENVTIIGDEQTYDVCVHACQTFVRQPHDRPIGEQVRQCVNDSLLWYEVTDVQGNRGWVSRRFLEEW